MSEVREYKVTVLAHTARAVRVKVDGLGIRPWLPRMKVALPETVHRGEQLTLAIPRWIIRNEIGEPDR